MRSSSFSYAFTRILIRTAILSLHVCTVLLELVSESHIIEYIAMESFDDITVSHYLSSSTSYVRLTYQ
jgi:hypothetical protein